MDINTGLKFSEFCECTLSFGELDECAQELIKAAVIARKYAYAPYTKFKTGAAFRTSSGCIFGGCTVENAAFFPSCCAERVAIMKAVSEGCHEFSEGAVAAGPEDTEFTTPCGVCRQVINEFAPEDIRLYIVKDKECGQGIDECDPVLCTSIFKLLPRSFNNFD